ncbi:hypothetical protein NB311A_08702 [Nitrobacter sp. Nb-311A]|uniref:DUF4339 domain-containing protein n=1 Tax=Nitrobacter sp. Nb-311A TaxID=314253 RepID=UPI0000686725|nr:DUF4339 domain-containing protein [Nitrobacter sp. Nb-311A]EAQ33442.1 hypothetical protein NB311A_08702 [Nitrobacter sp. Nb-311A]
MTDDSRADGEGWFYTQGGQRKGPFAADELHKLLAARTIDGEAPIWRKGLADWQPLRKTKVGAQLNDTPPPIAPSHLNNGLVWALAVVPIVYVFVDAASSNISSLISFSSWTIIPLRSAVFGLSRTADLAHSAPDECDAVPDRRGATQTRRLQLRMMTAFALLLAPAYLFMRAQRLRQTPTYGYVWIASFIVSIILRVL